MVVVVVVGYELRRKKPRTAIGAGLETLRVGDDVLREAANDDLALAVVARMQQRSLWFEARQTRFVFDAITVGETRHERNMATNYLAKQIE